MQKYNLYPIASHRYPKRGEILHINLPYIPRGMPTLEPQRTTEYSAITIAHALYEGLMRFKEDGHVELGQAESVEIDATRRFYRFRLKKNGWSNGALVTALDFEITWKQTLLKNIQCPNVFWFFYIKNAKALYERRVGVESLGVRSLEENILEVELEKPISFFLHLLGCSAFLPLHSMSIDGFLPDPNSTSYPLISNGPFKLTHWIPYVELIFEKNDCFHRAKEISLRKIHFNYINSEISAIDRFLAHSMDVLGRPFLSLIKHKAMRYLFKKQHFVPYPIAATTCAILNLHLPPFHILKMRRALQCGIDRASLVKRLTMFEDGVATNLIPPVFFPHEKRDLKSSSKLSLLEARELFKQALEENGLQAKEMQENFTIQYAQSELYFNLAMDLKETWEMLFDIEIRIEQLSFNDLFQKLSSRSFSICLLSWQPDFYHPIAMLNRFRYQDNSKNYPGWHNPQFSSLLNQAENAATIEESFDLCMKAEKILLEEIPVIPIMHGKYPVMTQAYVKNLSISPLGIINFDKIYLDENYEEKQNPLYPEREKIVALLQECIKPPFEHPIPVTDLLMR